MQLVLASIGIGLAGFMNVLDTTIAVVALPTIGGSLAVTPSQSSWVLTLYGVSLAVVLPLSGWVTRRYGLVRTFFISVILFTLTSWLCAAAQSFNQLLLFRALQGASGGLLLPLSQSLLMRVYPPERHGLALGIWGLASAVAPVMGPLLGGYLTDTVGWPWIFYINVPFGFLSAYICWSLLQPYETESTREPVDLVGLALLVVGVISGQLLLDRGHELDWFGSVEIRTLAILAGVCFILFLAWERDTRHPIVDLSLLRHRRFVLGTVLVSVFYSSFVLLGVIYPLWLQTVLGYNAQWAGIVSAPTSIFPLIAMPLIGNWVRTRDPRPLVTIGTLIVIFAMMRHAFVTTSTPPEHIALSRLLIGCGMPFLWMPLMMTALVGLPPDKLSSATGLFNFVRMLASSMGTALGITLWDERSVVHREWLVAEVARPSADREQAMLMLGGADGHATQALATLEYLVQREARTLALQDLAVACAMALVVVGLLVWALPAPRKATIVNAAAGGRA